MKFFPITIFLILLNFIHSAGQTQKIFKDAATQTLLMLKEVEAAKTQEDSKKGVLVSPRTLATDGKLVLVPSKDWTSGFFPGVLWYLYEFIGQKPWEDQAKTFTAQLEKEKLNGGTHDMGFKIYCSYGNGYRLTGDPAYREVIIQSAKTLATRFNPKVGCIRSWDHNSDKWQFPVIIDNMMNLELLFAATKLTGDSSFYKIAVSHANTTMKNHFRPNFSSYHVVDYDPATGNVLHKQTHQGYAHESSWARGQAWGVYGYTMCYRETQNPQYLEQAEKIAAFILNNPRLPKDLIPYWDFDAPNIPNEPRDASAAAVIASAFYELSRYSAIGKFYLKKADQIMKNLTNEYRSPIGQNRGFILIHSTGSKPMNSEVDVPLNYADYYYLEALLRAKQLKQKPVSAEKKSPLSW
jgi:rhamnogalacturonyl hydrolase YesR